MTNMTKSMWVNLTHRNNMTSEGTMLESKIRSLVYAKRDLAEVGSEVILNEEYIIDMHYPRAYRLINDIVDIATKLLEAGKEVATVVTPWGARAIATPVGLIAL